MQKGKTVWTIVWKVAILVATIGSIWLANALCFALLPFRFFDNQYADYAQSRAWVEEGDGCDILIVGDSLGQTAWWPELLSDRTYNFSRSGASPIELYFSLRDYLRHQDAPKALLYTVTPYRFLYFDIFWYRFVYFHELTKEDIIEIYNTIPNFADATPLGGGQNAFLKEILLYYTWSPLKYGSVFFKHLFLSEEELSRSRYADLARSRGFLYYPDGYDGCDEVNWRYAYDSFAPSEILDYYFRKTIELCRDNGIAFCYQPAPQSESTYRQIPSEFAAGYRAYLEAIAAAYPEAAIDTGLPHYDDSCFKDSAHMNSKGTTRFSLEMREKYRVYFNPDEKDA